jgi:hypothetical protein
MPADRIVQEIVLTGDAQLRARMDALGLSGSKAFKRIQDGAEKSSQSVTGAGGRLSSALTAITSRFAAVGSAAENVDKRFDAIVKSADVFTKRLTIATGVVSGLVAGIAALALGSGKTAENIDVGAKAAGISTDNFQKLSSAFEILGLGGDAVTGIFNKMNRSLGTSRKSALEQQKAVRDLTDQYTRGEITAAQFLAEQEKLRKSADTQIDAFSRLGVTFQSTGGDAMEGFRQFADAFAKMPDGIEKTALELDVFSRTGSKLAAAFEGGSAGLQKIIDEGQRVAPALDPAILAIGGKLDDAFDKLQLSIKNTKERFTLLFGPALTTLIDAVTNLIVKNRDTILEFGASIVSAITPIINDISALLSGDEIDQNGFVAKAQVQINEFAKAVKGAVIIVKGAWDGLVAVLDIVAAAINAIFGTEFTGQALAVVAVLGVFSGAFATIGTVIGGIISVVGLLDAALAAAFGPAGAALVGIAALGLAIGALIAQIPLVQQAFDLLLQGFNATVEFFKAGFALIESGWNALWDGAASFATSIFTKVTGGLDWIISKAKEALTWIKSLGGGGDQSGTANFARGGRVFGPGTGTSDSILARVSRGEFVVRAAAVQRYGEGVFNALNQMRLPKRIGFAAGGLVDGLSGALNGALGSPFALPSPALLPAGAGNTLNLTIGHEAFTGLRTDDETIG